MILEEFDHLLLATLIRFQERGLIGRNVFAARWVGIGQRRIGQERFERAITRQFRATQHFHLGRIQWEQEHVFEIIIVIRGPNRREGHHRRKTFFQMIRETVDRFEGAIARFHQIFSFVGREITGQGHEAFVKERIDGPSGGNGELGEKFDRLLQVTFALREQDRHLPEPRRGGQSAFLRGVVLEKHPNQVIVDVGGVGYDLTIPVSTFSALPDQGAEVRLRVHTHVREDAIALFGFHTSDEKSLFEKLISVSGIGPKLAVTVLSGLAAGDLINAIRGGDLQTLVRVPGIGKKTAERLVLELKDKLDFASATSVTGAPKPKSSFSPDEEDVISALLNIGANRASAETAVMKAKQQAHGASFEDLFRTALKLLR